MALPDLGRIDAVLAEIAELMEGFPRRLAWDLASFRHTWVDDLHLARLRKARVRAPRDLRRRSLTCSDAWPRRASFGTAAMRTTGAQRHRKSPALKLQSQVHHGRIPR